eukprot:3798928-Alexandrium_andersonii.AAC.1
MCIRDSASALPALRAFALGVGFLRVRRDLAPAARRLHPLRGLALEKHAGRPRQLGLKGLNQEVAGPRSGFRDAG